MKRVVVSVITAVFLVTVLAFCAGAEEVRPVYVNLNGVSVDCASYGQEATIVEGRTLVPLRAIFEALGADVIWDKNTRTVLSARNGTLVELEIGSNILVKNRQNVEIDVPAQIMNGRTMVPARAIAESFGVAVEWDKHTRTVLLTSTDKTNKKSNGDIESVLRDSKVYSIFNYGMTMQECWDLISHEGAKKELVAFRDGRAEIHISKNLDKFEYADSEITGDCDIIFVRLLFESDYLYSVGVISNYCDTLEESLEALEPIVEHYGSDYESDPRYDDSDDIRWYTWKNENEKVVCDFSDVYESATDVNSRLGNNYSLFLTDIQAKAQIDADEVKTEEEPSDSEQKPDLNEKEMLEEAEKVLVKVFDAVLEMNLTEAAKYTTNPEIFSELDIGGVDDMLAKMNFDRDLMAEDFVNSMAESEEDKEIYRAFGQAMADTSVDMIKGAFEKIHYEILSYEIVDADRIKYEIIMYIPDITVISESFSTVVETAMYYATAEIMAMGEELEGKSQKEIFDIMASSFRTISEEMTEQLIAETENVASEPSFGYLVKVDGEWLVEIDGEYEWELGELKDLYFE